MKSIAAYFLLFVILMKSISHRALRQFFLWISIFLIAFGNSLSAFDTFIEIHKVGMPPRLFYLGNSRLSPFLYAFTAIDTPGGAVHYKISKIESGPISNSSNSFTLLNLTVGEEENFFAKLNELAVSGEQADFTDLILKIEDSLRVHLSSFRWHSAPTGSVSDSFTTGFMISLGIISVSQIYFQPALLPSLKVSALTMPITIAIVGMPGLWPRKIKEALFEFMYRHPLSPTSLKVRSQLVGGGIVFCAQAVAKLAELAIW